VAATYIGTQYNKSRSRDVEGDRQGMTSDDRYCDHGKDSLPSSKPDVLIGCSHGELTGFTATHVETGGNYLTGLPQKQHAAVLYSYSLICLLSLLCLHLVWSKSCCRC